MNNQGNLFRSKVARRVFFLFIVSALIPVIILAVLSLNQVRIVSTEQVASRLKQDAKFYGLSLFDRLKVVEEELLFHASMLDAKGTPPSVGARDAGHLSDWRIHQNGTARSDGTGETHEDHGFDEGAIAHMKNGRSVLSVSVQESGYPALFMSRIVNLDQENSPILSARIHESYLWGDQDRFGEKVSACVLGSSYSYLHCTNAEMHPVGKYLKDQGGLTVQAIESLVESKDMLMGRWVLFMQPNYFVNKWNVLLFQHREEAFAQVKQFSGIYAIVILMVFLVVVMFTIYLIRRNTVPLEALLEGIRRFSEQKFSSRVKVNSKDEYKEVADAFNYMSERIGNQINRLKTQAYVDRLILSRPSVDDIVEIAHDGIRRLLVCDSVDLALVEDHHSRVFHLKEYKPQDIEIGASRYFTLDMKVVDKVTQGDTVVVDASEHELQTRLQKAGIADCNYYLVLPVLNVDELFGIFILGFQDQPGQEEVDLGKEFSNRIAVAFANAAWEEKLYNQARYDTLTSLPNRASLEERLEQEISHASRVNEYIVVLFLDLDRFKNINDSLGHEFGDAVLKEMSSRLHTSLREEDTVARLGGDEFVVMLRGLESSEMAGVTATTVAEKIVDIVSRPVVLDDHEIRMTTSIGISVYPTDAEDINTLLRNADSAMYHAKDLGRGNFQFYSEELNAAANYRLQMETKLHRAIEKEEFELHYQPKIDSRTQKVISCEALIRWTDLDGTRVEPSKFISVAEDIGLTTVIGEWALKKASSQAKAWQIPVSVNISARHFYHGNLVDHVKSALEESDLEPKYLEIEITETTTMHNMERSVQVLSALKEVGVRISIDDFGTGYSSLNYLKHFPVDTLKIDRIFIKNILQDEKDLAIVKSTVSLAHNLGLNVVAEGVEYEEQKRALDELGCDELQGYLYSRALPPEQFHKYLNPDIS